MTRGSEATVRQGGCRDGAAMVLERGVMDRSYHQRRLKLRSHRYRLNRRTDEVARALSRHHQGDLQVLLDVGTADGLMLEQLRPSLPEAATVIGLDLSLELLRCHSGSATVMQADAERLPIVKRAADVVVCTAVIEHVPAPENVVDEFARVLRPGGLLVLTTPDPMLEKVATALRLLKEDDHQRTFRLVELSAFVEQRGFVVLEARKFMFSPIGFPAEKPIERSLARLGLNFLLANQLVIARRRP